MFCDASLALYSLEWKLNAIGMHQLCACVLEVLMLEINRIHAVVGKLMWREGN